MSLYRSRAPSHAAMVRRTTLVEITDEGRARAESATAALMDSGFGLHGLDVAQTDRLTELITALRHAAGDFA